MAVRGEHVVFLGAGASRAFGFALTSDILPEILRRARACTFQNKHLRPAGACQTLLRTFSAVLPGADAKTKLPLVTHVLSLLDYCVLNQEKLHADLDLRHARELFDLAISDILDEPLDSSTTLKPADLVRWVLREGATVVSTNYDFLGRPEAPLG